VAGRPKLRLAAQTALCLGTGSEAIRIAAPTGGQGHAEALVPEAVLRQEFQALALELLVLFPRPGELSAAAVAVLGAELRQAPDRFLAAHCTWAGTQGYVPAVHWRLGRDERRDVPLPPGHLLVVDAGRPFIMAVHESGRCLHRRRSLPAPGGSHFAVLLPLPPRPRTACLELDLCVAERPVRRVRSGIVLLPSVPGASIRLAVDAAGLSTGDHCAVCSDSLGAMALVRGRWGEVRSQYDALLAANLSSTHPVDRQVLLTRCRAWIVHRDYSQEVGPGCQVGFSTDLANRVQWDFRVPVGLGLQIPLRIVLEMAASGNAVRLRFERPGAGMLAEGLDDQTPVALILRPDIEDRCCHQVTRAYTGPEQAFQEAVRAVAAGFRFDPSGTHALLCTVSQGEFVLEPEWHYRVPYPVEAARGLSDAGDLFSPGYFRCPLAGGDAVVVSASCGGRPGPWPAEPVRETVTLPIEETARRALSRFVVRRDASRSVVAGYPWFLDWGRDTLICLRGIIAGGRLEEARDIIGQFARFERGGTLPNMIRGSDASDRDTSDAPFWLSVAVADYLRAAARPDILDLECGGRPLRQVLAELATAVVRGTENGIRMDPESGLVFSPAHFTWMDTNHPAATPRQGYPIEVQALWHAALRLLAAIGAAGMPWEELAARVRAAVSRRYPLGAGRGLSDCLEAEPGTRAQDARADDACRPNQLLAVTLGLVEGPVARSVVEACWPLLVPTGIRSLADQPVAYPLAVRHQGRLLNDPLRPYWGRYEGDEDTRRKPAYHNGTAWTWLLPSFAEALVSVYGPGAREPARSLLSGMASCMESGCLGHVPELTDGDAPHRPRGCVAQAWGVSELLRVLLLLRDETPASQGVSKQQGGAVSP
jgi:glycogen debranching enzyme